MLLTLMYHRVINTEFPVMDGTLRRHFEWLREQHVVVPGDKTSIFRRSYCLTFDDAFYDFYHTVYPLLKEFNLRAVLAVPTHYILDDTVITAETRLQVPYGECPEKYHTHATYCTWQEIQEMANSGHVIMASHSHNHPVMTNSDVDLDLEIIHSKELLEDKLHAPITSFVYPYGKTNTQVHRQVLQHYNYALRIGKAINLSWKNCHGYHYRLDADKYWPQQRHISSIDLMNYSLKYLSNCLRRR